MLNAMRLGRQYIILHFRSYTGLEKETDDNFIDPRFETRRFALLIDVDQCYFKDRIENSCCAVDSSLFTGRFGRVDCIIYCSLLLLLPKLENSKHSEFS